MDNMPKQKVKRLQSASQGTSSQGSIHGAGSQGPRAAKKRAPSAGSRKPVAYSLGMKQKVLLELEKGARVKDLVAKYGIKSNTISTWKKPSKQVAIYEQVEKGVTLHQKRDRGLSFPEIDAALLLWMRNVRAMSHPPPLTGETLKTQANK